jgi:SAM-dependent methyltransferase
MKGIGFTMNVLDAELLGLLADPLDHEPLILSPNASRLDNAAGHRSYRIYEGIPLLLPPRKRDKSPEREASAAETAAEAAYRDGLAVRRDGAAGDADDRNATARRGDELLERLLGAGTGPVLDVGCGTGRVAALSRGLGYAPLGIDLSLGQLRLASRRLPVVQGSAYALPFRDACLALVYTVFTIGALENFEASAREIHRVLKSGGRWINLCMHPCFASAHALEEADGSVRVKPGYLREGWSAPARSVPGQARCRAGAWHRPLSALVTPCVRAGFTLLGVDETGPDDPISLPDVLALSMQKR